jgi:hypothetical protein
MATIPEAGDNHVLSLLCPDPASTSNCAAFLTNIRNALSGGQLVIINGYKPALQVKFTEESLELHLQTLSRDIEWHGRFVFALG